LPTSIKRVPSEGIFVRVPLKLTSLLLVAGDRISSVTFVCGVE